MFIDLVNSFWTSIYYSVFTCKISFDTAENESSRVRCIHSGAHPAGASGSPRASQAEQQVQAHIPPEQSDLEKSMSFRWTFTSSRLVSSCVQIDEAKNRQHLLKLSRCILIFSPNMQLIHTQKEDSNLGEEQSNVTCCDDVIRVRVGCASCRERSQRQRPAANSISSRQSGPKR